MKLKMIALAAALGFITAAAPAAAQATKAAAVKPMNYDCTKAGNKNKAACKNVAVAAPAKPATMTPAAKPMAATPAKPMNYDCTKAGNKNKAACKSVAPVAMAPAAKPTAAAPAMATAKPRASATSKAANPNEVAATLKNGKVVHYDCSKAGNKDKKACGAK